MAPHETPQPPFNKLLIISYGHANGPYTPPPATATLLSFSTRDIPNPPARLRRTHTGLSARLQKEVMASKEAQSRLHNILIEVEATIGNADIGSNRQDNPEDVTTEVTPDTSKLVVVAIMCEEGKHRSVSFAEELSKQIKPKGWEVTVQHRDLPCEHLQVSNSDQAADDRPRTKKARDQAKRKARPVGRGFVNDEND